MIHSKRFFLFLMFIGMFFHSSLTAQKPSLKKDLSFFRTKSKEYQSWLKFIQCDHVIKVDSVYASNDKVTVVLMPAFPTGKHTCDSMQSIWMHLEETHTALNKSSFHERLLKKWAFLCEVSTSQAEVIVQCHKPPHFRAIAHGDNGEIPVDVRSVRSASYAPPVQEFSDFVKEGSTKANELNVKLKDKNATKVCEETKKFCTLKYGKLPKARFIWDAVLEQTDINDNEFQLEVTYITRVICPDGYYEYHKIFVQTEQQGPDVLLKVTLDAKYGSGIIWAPRKNAYKDMETTYKKELDEYRNIFFKQIVNANRR